MITEGQIRLIRALQEPLPLVERPFEDIALRVGMTEEDVLATIRAWINDGTIRRFGARVKHQAVGYTANGMCVWDVPKDRVDAAGAYVAQVPEVSHCYTRPRLPQWPYNFYAMIHGKKTSEVEDLAQKITDHLGLAPGKILFSTREFKKSTPRLFDE